MASPWPLAARRAIAAVFGLTFALAIGGCARPSPSAQTPAMLAVEPSADIRTMVDDGTTGTDLGHFHFQGHWEAIRGRVDGRSLGTSTRSFHRADIASLSFHGTQVRLYGVVGPKGGDALVSVDGSSDQRRVSFRGAAYAANTLVYTSPVLDPSVHTLTVFVTGRDEKSGVRGFVNVDSAVVSGAPGRRD